MENSIETFLEEENYPDGEHGDYLLYGIFLDFSRPTN
jgi:hypothetical protein